MRKPALIIAILILVTMSLSVVRIYVGNSLSISGVALGKMQEEISSYKTRNTILSEKLLKNASLTSISSKAVQLGFVERKTSFLLTNPIPLAVKQ